MQVNSREEQTGLRRRILVIGCVMVAAFLAIGRQLYVLQVGESERWSLRSESNRMRLRRIPPTRGLVLDAHGEPLVDNRASFDVVIVPEDTKDLGETVRRASELLGFEPPPIDALSKAAERQPPYEGLVIQHDVDYQSVVKLETHEFELPGVSLEVVPLRTYPFGSLAAHTLGYVGEVSDKDLEANPDYRMGDLIGKSGAERAWDPHLRGVPGVQQIEVDSLGNRLRVLSEIPETRGNSLVLTLDRRLQQFAEQLLEGHEGSIVALRPATGEILAMASQPQFDPNVFARGIRRADWAALLDAPLKPLSNRALQGEYPPGSTFKIVTATAALEEGAVTPFTRLFCGGSYRFGNRSYRCWKPGGHGSVNLHDALVQSCDVYFYQVGQRLGVDTIAEYAHRFGLGAPTGVSLAHERPGLIPTSAWKKRRFKEKWYAGETLSVAIGQGYVLTTPLQMANLIAVVANGGTRYRPQYLSRVKSPAGESLTEVPAEPLGEAGFRKSTLHQIREALRDVVNSPRGTGKKSQLERIDVGGKTGTAQVFRMRGKAVKTQNLPRPLRDHAWFVAFAPVDDPEIAIAIVLEHAGQGGGAVAAPLARDLADFYFASTRGRTYELAGAGSADAKLAQAGAPAVALPVQMSPDMRARLASLAHG